MTDNLREKIEKDFKEALRKRSEIEISTLRLLRASIFNKEKEKRYKIFQEKANLEEDDLEKESKLNDEEILEVIMSEIKKRKEAIFEFERGKRTDLSEREKKEMDILGRYLPKMLSEKEIEKMAKEAIEKLKVKEIKDMGIVMKELMPKIKGRADGSLVSQVVKKILSKK